LWFSVEAGDTVLGEHLQNSVSNATYISNTTQNQLIEACGTLVREVILKRIKEAKSFSVVYDETTDISTISQLSVVITFVHNAVFEDCEASQEPKITREISEWEDTNASSKAKTLTSSLTNFKFIISSHCQVFVLDLFLPLSKLFQKSSLDVGVTKF
jgi:hypothetical protein